MSSISTSVEDLGVTPKLEYLLQYPVKNVLVKKDGGYAIEFENGALLADERDDAEAPQLENVSLLMVIYEQEGTRLRFGNTIVNPATRLVDVSDEVEITLVPGAYSITDPRFPDAPAYRPQVRDESVEARDQSIREKFEELAAGRAPEHPERLEEG